MDNLHLVTGYRGYDHITAMDQGAFNAALIGTGDFVLNKGSVFRAQVFTNNTVRVYDGELMMQGRFVRLAPGNYVDLTIDNGAQGMMRTDIVVVRYTKDDNGVEDVNFVVKKGTAVASNPLPPDCTKGDITNGNAKLHEFPLWRIPIDGLTVGTPVSIFDEPYNESMRTLPDIRNQMAQLTSDIFSVAARIETGSYVGNGQSIKAINTPINPKFVIISASPGGQGGVSTKVSGTVILFRGLEEYVVYMDTSSGNVKYIRMRATFSDLSNGHRIQTNISSHQGMSESEMQTFMEHCVFNADGETYHYVIVGN